MTANQLFNKVSDFEEAYEKQNPQITFISGTQYEAAYRAFAEKYGKHINLVFLDLLESENFHTCRRVCVEWLKNHL